MSQKNEIKVGDKVKIKHNSKFWMDFSSYESDEEENIIFTVKKIDVRDRDERDPIVKELSPNEAIYCYITAKGYGDIEDYGDGSIYIAAESLTKEIGHE